MLHIHYSSTSKPLFHHSLSLLPFQKVDYAVYIYNYIYIHMLWKAQSSLSTAVFLHTHIHTYTHTYMPASIHEYMNMWIHTYSVTFAGYIAHFLSVSSPLAPQITSNHSNQNISPPNWDNNKNHPNIKKRVNTSRNNVAMLHHRMRWYIFEPFAPAAAWILCPIHKNHRTSQ